ncbi:MAG: FAD-dependent oxidoreductase, partial [Alphaproteobacteria bacterium]
MDSIKADVIVVGAGNAAFAAAFAARESGASAVMLERAPVAEAGGNTRFTAGAMRVVYDGVDDLRALIPELTDDEIATTDFGAYSSDQFFDDMFRVTGYRANADMVESLVNQSRETLRWMRGLGIRFAPMYRRQAYRVDGRFRFWGGLTVEASGGGEGLIEAWTRAAAKAGIAIHYGARAERLLADDEGIHGVALRHEGRTIEARGKAVILACGGFEANPEWRTRYLGPGWDLAKVRGSRFNTGDGIRMALDIGAASYGNWSGCHAVAWDRDAPEFGDLAVGDGFQKHSYPMGIILNARGQRFVDEGADFRNYTYRSEEHT